MSPRTGRPRLDDPKSESVHFRLTVEDKRILDSYCEQENVQKTEAIRRGIRKLKDDIKA